MWKRVTIVVVVVVGLVAIFAFIRVGRPGFIKVPSGGMANTVLPGDSVLTKSRLGTIQRGDLIVFQYPKDENVRYLSRVIALAGETVQVVGKKVLVNGEPLPERHVSTRVVGDSLPLQEINSDGSGPYTVYYDADISSREEAEQQTTFGGVNPYTVPVDACFVLGDNRDDSFDSRSWGPLPLANILSRPVLIYASESGDPSRYMKRIN